MDSSSATADDRARNDKALRERLDYELSVIHEMGFDSYFLIVWDFIKYARDNDIPVGPGRGSAVGSVVSYCLGITALDPLRFGLYFERFLNPDRISMPDIDIDFCIEGRERVIQYVAAKYGGRPCRRHHHLWHDRGALRRTQRRVAYSRFRSRRSIASPR